ncbi:MAG: helix-turn-helix domain-containing protein [Nitrososphaera sp.]
MEKSLISPSILRACTRDLGLNQIEIAAKIGASQGQVSRMLTGQTKQRSRAYKKLCEYVINKKLGITRERVIENAELVDALAQTWDGTTEHAKALSAVILSLRNLRNNS